MKMPAENIDTVMFAPCGMNCKVKRLFVINLFRFIEELKLARGIIVCENASRKY